MEDLDLAVAALVEVLSAWYILCQFIFGDRKDIGNTFGTSFCVLIPRSELHPDGPLRCCHIYFWRQKRYWKCFWCCWFYGRQRKIDYELTHKITFRDLKSFWKTALFKGFLGYASFILTFKMG